MINTKILSTYPRPLSSICLGTAQYGLGNEEQAFDFLDRWYDMGGRFLDTANVYGRWSGRMLNESEIVIGHWLAARRIDDMVITTKCCHYLPTAHDVSRVNEKCAFEDLDESRRTLGLDVIDIWLTHRDNEDIDIRRIIDFLTSAVDRGMVTRIGLSNYRAERVKTALDYLGTDRDRYLVGISNEWSLHEESVMKENGGSASAPDGMVATDAAMHSILRSEKLPIIPFSAAAHGFYDKHSPDSMSASDREAYEMLKKQSEDTGLSLTALSVKYIMNHPGITAIPIVSVSRVQQMEEYGKL